VRIEGEGTTILQAVFAVGWYDAVRENLFHPPYFPPTSADLGNVSVQVLTWGPHSQWASIRQLYPFMIVCARRHVLIQSPYFVLDAAIAEALRSAALAGVDVNGHAERATVRRPGPGVGGQHVHPGPRTSTSAASASTTSWMR
jgi:cardiolipin synthase